MKHEDLFDKFLQRDLTRQESEELKALLKHDAEAGRRFVEHVGETSLLIRVGAQLCSIAKTAGERAGVDALPLAFRSSWWKWAAAACGLGLTLVAWVAWRAVPEFRATVVASSSEVTILRDLGSVAVEPGLPLRPGDTVRVTPHGRAVVTFDGEATRVELQSGAQVRFTATRQGKRIELSNGAIEATVAPQPKWRPLIVLTPQAKTRVVGTRLAVAAEAGATRLEVSQGAAEFVRRSDGKVLLVKAGFCATAGPKAEWCAHPFLPAPWRSQDIGAVRLRGQARFDGTVFRVGGAGQDTCCTKDQLHFLYQPLHGDGEIRACVREVEFTDPEAKASVTIRHNLKSVSPQASLGLTAAGGLEFESRKRAESRMQRIGHTSTPCWLRLVRRGKLVTAFHSVDGTTWVEAASEKFSWGEEAYIGLGVTSFNHAALNTSVFDQVAVSAAGASPDPAP